MTIKSTRSGGAHEPHERYTGAPGDALTRVESASATMSRSDRMAGLQQSASRGNHAFMSREELDDLYG